MNNEELLLRMKMIDPESKRVPEGLLNLLTKLTAEKDAEIVRLREALTMILHSGNPSCITHGEIAQEALAKSNKGHYVQT